MAASEKYVDLNMNNGMGFKVQSSQFKYGVKNKVV